MSRNSSPEKFPELLLPLMGDFFSNSWPGRIVAAFMARLRPLARHFRRSFRFSGEGALGVVLLLFLLLMLFAPARREPAGKPPAFQWNPGYWQALPRLGMTRIIPLAGNAIISPPASFGASQVRGRATQ